MENLTVKELTQLNKKVVHVFGKVHYFIGINNEKGYTLISERAGLFTGELVYKIN